MLAASWAAEVRAQAGYIDVAGVTFVSSRASANEFVLWAENAHVDSDGRAVELEQIQLSVAGDEQRLGLELRCKRGRIELETSDFRLEGEVTGRIANGQRFEAVWVGYDDSEALLYSDAPVVIRERGGVYRGGGFRYDMKRRRFRLLAGTSVVRQP